MDLGCGLDKLDWSSVKEKITSVFGDSPMEVTVYTLPNSKNTDNNNTNNNNTNNKNQNNVTTNNNNNNNNAKLVPIVQQGKEEEEEEEEQQNNNSNYNNNQNNALNPSDLISSMKWETSSDPPTLLYLHSNKMKPSTKVVGFDMVMHISDYCSISSNG